MLWLGGMVISIGQSTLCGPPALRALLPFYRPRVEPSSHVEFEKLANLQAKLEEGRECCERGCSECGFE